MTRRPLLLISAAVLLAAQPASAQPAPAARRLTSFQEMYGWSIGDDYHLATYDQLTAHWKKLATESDRMKLVEIGKTEEGRPQWMSIITSPENHKNLAKYQDIARRLALAEGLTDDQARALAAEGKAVVWIDGGLHATEVLGAHQLMETVWQLLSKNDPETLRFLRDVIILCVHANPDGHQLVASGYMKESDPKKRYYVPPRLYQKYVGHDNNRDFYLSSQSESTNMNRILYREWFPQIMYNHHQTGPPGTILFAPPFRDPHNYQFDPLIPNALNLVGAAMHTRFAAEGKPGATQLEGANYSTWYNGGLRTTTYFHNMIGLLTETNGSPIPMEIPFLFERQLMSKDLLYPIGRKKEFHFREAIEYSLTANRAVLDLASKHREDFLFNIYQMGRNSIARGNRDHWTITPSKLARVKAAYDKENPLPTAAEMTGGARRPPGAARNVPDKYWDMLHTPEARDPRGYILSADQPDFPTATRFIHSLIKTGVTVHRATAAFTVNGKNYPAGSYVVKGAQAFRPHVLDMFEPQDHPNDFQYPGGPPKPPYDSAGYTLAYTMGIEFDRILEGFDGPFEKLTDSPKPPRGSVKSDGAVAGYLLSHRPNDSFIATNRLLKAGEQVFWTAKTGEIYVPAKPSTKARLDAMAAELGLTFTGVAQAPKTLAHQLRPIRIGLWDNYSGSMPSGWTRWIFEKYEFPFEVIYPQQVDAGDLRSKFDVILFVTGGVPAADRPAGGGEEGGPTLGRGSANWMRSPNEENVPAADKHRVGTITVAKSVPSLRKFLEAGGTVVTIGNSTSLAKHLGLPVSDWLVERLPNGTERPLGRDKFYIPGSVMEAAVDNTHPLAYGMPAKADVYFDASPVFHVQPAGLAQGIRPVAWFDSTTPLRSGWAWGQHYLKGGAAAVEASVGEGKLVLLGPEVTFRAQTHGTFKLLFNALYYGAAAKVSP